MANLRVINIGAIISGDIDAPLAAGDTVVVRDGTIAFVGEADQAPTPLEDEITIDAVEFCRVLSGRADGAGLLTQEVPF